MKLKWKVGEKPTGRYRSFAKRGWPTAEYPCGKPAAFLRCDDSYTPSNLALGNHSPITVHLCHHQHPKRGNSWAVMRSKITFETLRDAKDYVQSFVDSHPEYAPLEKKS